jgi:hypothetical protein
MTMTKEEINATFTNIMKEIRTLSLELGEDVGVSYSASCKSNTVALHNIKDLSLTSMFHVEDDDKVLLYANEPFRRVSTFSLDDCIEDERRREEWWQMRHEEMIADSIEDYEPEEEEEEDEEEDDA